LRFVKKHLFNSQKKNKKTPSTVDLKNFLKMLLTNRGGIRYTIKLSGFALFESFENRIESE